MSGNPAPTKIEITPAMIKAGVSALYEAMGYQLLGRPEVGVEAVFAAMLRARLANPEQGDGR